MLGSHLRQSKLCRVCLPPARKHRGCHSPDGNPLHGGVPFWCCSSWVISPCSGGVRDVWLTGEGRAEASSHDRLLLHLPLPCICVSVTHWHGAPLSLRARRSRQQRSEAEKEAWNPFTVSSPRFVFPSLRVSPARSVECEGMELRTTGGGVGTGWSADARTPIFLSQSGGLARALSEPSVLLISHTW